MTSWAELDLELDRWSAVGRAAILWWRDDDAAEQTAAVDRLLAVAEATHVPLHLAVVPANETDALAEAVEGCSQAWVLQHGFAHTNHAGRGEGAWELGLHRPATVVLDELRAGFGMLRSRHKGRFLPVLVPPWNRIAADLLPSLPELGFAGLSLFAPRRKRCPAPGLIEINPHCDPIKWRGGARFTGVERALDDFARHLTARRLGRADADEPTGLVTHHLGMDAAGWDFVEELVRRTGAHPAARWVAVGDLLAA